MITHVCPTCQKEFSSDSRRQKYCKRSCYNIARSVPKMPLEVRFWQHVDKSAGPDACWPWTGCINAWGYGTFNNPDGSTIASRIALELTIGKLADGMKACHKCDNPPCCNPSHLFPGTNADNTHDMLAKGRDNRLAIQGVNHHKAKLTDELVIEICNLYAEGYNQIELGKLFNVTRSLIGQLVRGEIWTHLPRPAIHRGRIGSYGKGAR